MIGQSYLCSYLYLDQLVLMCVYQLHLMLLYDDLIIWYPYDVLALDLSVYYCCQFSVIFCDFLCCQNKQKTKKKILCNSYADGIALGIGLPR